MHKLWFCEIFNKKISTRRLIVLTKSAITMLQNDSTLKKGDLEMLMPSIFGENLFDDFMDDFMRRGAAKENRGKQIYCH